MKLDKAINRDRKHHKDKSGMQVDGKSIFILEEQKKKKAEKNKAKQKKQKLNLIKEFEEEVFSTT